MLEIYIKNSVFQTYFSGFNHTAYNERAKAFNAFLLTVTSDFVRQDKSPTEIEQFLLNSCNIISFRMQKYLEYYVHHKVNMQFSLLNIGNCIPHLTDVQSTVDYIVKVIFYNKKNNKNFLWMVTI